MKTPNSINLKQILTLWLLGLLSVLSLLPVNPQLIAIQAQPVPFSMVQIQDITFVQSGAFILAAVILGSIFSTKVNLSAPALDATLNRQPIMTNLKPKIAPALLGGVLGGAFIVIFSLTFQALLPPE